MRGLADKRTIRLWAAALATTLAAACDRTDERVENARGLVSATVDQLSGGGAPPPTGVSALETASVAERAVSGAFVRTETVTPAAARSRFAVGSIIAKPRQMAAQEPIMGLEAMERPEFDEEEDDAERAPSPREALGEGAARIAPRRLPVLDRAQMRELRKDPLENWEANAQLEARSTMLEAMAKYGLQGRIETSRAGQMKIDFDEDSIDPTQFQQEVDVRELRRRPPEMARIRPPKLESARIEQPILAANVSRECPSSATPDLMRRDAALAVECVIEELKRTDEFEYVEKDFIFEHQFARKPRPDARPAFAPPNDPLWSLQWNFVTNGSGDGASPGGAGFTDFWRSRASRGSTDVVVAVVDTGLEMSHPDIAGSPNVAAGWDMVSDPAMGNDGDGRDGDANDPGDLCDPTEPFAENSFHGTHVAGTIGAAATNNAAGVAGGAWNVTIVPVRALGKCGGRLSDINDAIRWAGGLIPAIDTGGVEVWNENPADIINLSIGLFELCPASLQDAIDAVTERGAVVVAAAGNARVSTSFYSPGGCRNVISVAASDGRGVLAPYSNFGDEVDLVAPGGDLARDDNNDGRPDGVLSTKSSADCFDPLTGESVETCYYAFEHGTSMAAPHAAAALALIKSAEPGLTGPELSARLMSALRERSAEQCARPCVEADGPEIPGSGGLCRAACGAGLLDLGLLTE